MVVACNNLMGIKSNDHGTWRRIRTVPFKSLFTEKPVSGDKDKPYQFKIDKYIDEKFDRWKEVMASMLVDIVYKTDGVVEDCSIVLEKSNEYRESQDYISEFIKDRVIKDSEGRIKKTELNNDFSIWYASNYGGRGPSQRIYMNIWTNNMVEFAIKHGMVCVFVMNKIMMMMYLRKILMTI